MLQPKKCAICNTINDGSRHFCSKCGAFLSSTPVQQKKVHSVWEEEGGGGIVNDPFGADSQDSLMNTDPYGGGQAGSDVQSAGAQFGNVQQMQTRQGNFRKGNGVQNGGVQNVGGMQTGNAQAGAYIVRCPQCGAVHPAPDKKLPNVCSKCFYFFQQGVDQVVLAANLQSTQNSQSTQGSGGFNSQRAQGGSGFRSQSTQGSSGFNHAQKGFGQGKAHAQAQAGLTFNSQYGGGQQQTANNQYGGGQQQTANNQNGAGRQQTGQGPLAGRSALASSRPDDSRLMLLAISNKKMPPAEISPQGDIIGDGGTIFRNLKTGIKLSLWHTPAGWYARAMQGNVLYNGLPMNVGYQKKLADGDMFSFDAGQFRVEIIG